MFLRIREYYFNSWIFCHNATCQCADCLKKMFVWLARIFSATVPHVSLFFISCYHCKWVRVYIHTRSGRARDRVVSTGLFFSHMFFNRIMFYLNVCSREVLIHYFFQEAGITYALNECRTKCMQNNLLFWHWTSYWLRFVGYVFLQCRCTFSIFHLNHA